jgi:hypothetical protein
MPEIGQLIYHRLLKKFSNHGKGAEMSNSKEEALFETMRAACARQFGFNPLRVTAEIRYLGKEGHGKDQVHVFRDSKTHSQIVLKNNFATLRETHGDKPHWSEAEKAHYKETDAEIDAQNQQRQADLEYARQSPLYLEHREQLLSHYKASSYYKAGSTPPRDAAKALISVLADAHDARLASFVKHYGSNDVEHLAHHLLSPCHLEFEASNS